MRSTAILIRVGNMLKTAKGTPTCPSPPDDLARLVQEVLTRLGFDASADDIARGVRKLNYGLPAEDEFSVICAWLGNCRIIHKIDQQQTPPISRNYYQIPDLVADFYGVGAVLIEVKRCNDKTLSFKPEYYRKLINYEKFLGKPLLVAWKFHNIWTLFDIRRLKLARINYNISHADAMQHNLLGILAGDVAYVLMPDVGVHFELNKEHMLSREENTDGWNEQWKMRIERAYITDGKNNHRIDLHPETQQLIATWPLEDREKHTENKILKSFVVGESHAQFAHTALVHLLA